ncbi:MAG TPA: hypothetical protein VIJ14_07905 [Rhabdochlamydiaceae bacterium]
MTFTHGVSTDSYGPYKIIVNSVTANGTHTTLAAGIAAASPGDTIFLASLVTENVTLPAGINIKGADLNTSGITGTLEINGVGSSLISDITLTTNLADALLVDGTDPTVVIVENCSFDCSNYVGINFTTSNVNARILIKNCVGQVGSGIAAEIFQMNSTGSMYMSDSDFISFQVVSNHNQTGSGQTFIRRCSFQNGLEIAGNGNIFIEDSEVDTSGTNSIAMIINTANVNTVLGCNIFSGTADAIECSQNCIVSNCYINATGAGVISGSGTLYYSNLTFANTDTITINNQIPINWQPYSTAGTNTTAVRGTSSFDSTYFSDVDGWVSLIGSPPPVGVVSQIEVDAFTAPGTNPVVPDGTGLITVTGAQVAAGTTANVIRTDSLSPNDYTIEIQRSQAVASSTVADNGVSHFDSSSFSVDANGFVTFIGTPSGTVNKLGVDTFTGPGTNPVLPNGSGLITVTGAQVAAGTTANVIRTDSLAANDYTIQIQRSQAVASSTVGDNGVSHFDSASFAVDANGFVTFVGSASPYFSLTPYIVGSDVHSQFTTISAAITQAIADGASKTDPKNIYVKPGIYTEDLTLADGINVLAMDQGPLNVQFPSNQQLSVKLVGRIILSVSSADSKVENIIIAPTVGLNCVECSGDSFICVLKGCIFSITGTATIFNVSGGGGDLVVDGCNNGTTGTQAMFATDPGGALTVIMTDTHLYSNAVSVVGGGGTGGLTLLTHGCTLTLNVDASGASSLNIFGEYTNYIGGTANLFLDAAGTLTTILCQYCSFSSTTNVFNINTTTGGSNTVLINCDSTVDFINAGTTNKKFLVSGVSEGPTIAYIGAVTSPISSSLATAAFVTSLTSGVSAHNTTGYNLLVNISVSVTLVTAPGVLELGVGPTSTPTVNAVTATLGSTGIYSITALVPSNYWLLVSNTGTLTIASITVQSCGV